MGNFFYRLILPLGRVPVEKVMGEDRDCWGITWSSVQGGGQQRISDTLAGRGLQDTGHRISKVSCLVSGG